MLLALAVCVSTAHAGIPAGFGETPGVITKNTPHYDLERLSDEGRRIGRTSDSSVGSLRLLAAAYYSPGTSASANLKTGVGAPLGVKVRMARGENLPSVPSDPAPPRGRGQGAGGGCGAGCRGQRRERS